MVREGSVKENGKVLRLAHIDDIPVLRELIDVSVRTLQAGDYTQAQIDSALGTLLGVDTQLIIDATYFVIEVDGQIAACGGWSRRGTLFGSDAAADRDHDALDPAIDAAKIRAFFVHPLYARRGLGTMLLRACEAAALAAGFKRFELGATLTGVKLYEAHGYQPIERIEGPYPILRMGKST